LDHNYKILIQTTRGRTLTRMDKGVIADYCHMTTMNER